MLTLFWFLWARSFTFYPHFCFLESLEDLWTNLCCCAKLKNTCAEFFQLPFVVILHRGHKPASDTFYANNLCILMSTWIYVKQWARSEHCAKHHTPCQSFLICVPCVNCLLSLLPSGLPVLLPLRPSDPIKTEQGNELHNKIFSVVCVWLCALGSMGAIQKEKGRQGMMGGALSKDDKRRS